MKSYLGDCVTEGVILNAGHTRAPEQPQVMCDAICNCAEKVNTN